MKLMQRAGMESIAPQHDLFADSITMIFQEIQEYIDKGHGVTANSIQALDFASRIEAMTFKRTGIKIKMIFNAGVLAACMPYYINKNHIFITEIFRGDFTINDQEAKIKHLDGHKGSVDLKNAKVSGMFSEHTHQLWMDVRVLYKYCGCSAREMTAIFLHELGHLFTTFEMMSRVEETNQILANIKAELRKDSKKTLHFQYRELQRISNGVLTDAELKDLESTESQTILGVKLFRIYIRMIKSQMPRRNYNETSCEQMADDFATRFGYGKELVTGLDNLMQWSPEKNAAEAFMQDFSSLIILFIMPALGFFALVAAPVVGVFALLVWGALLLASGDDGMDLTYDELYHRYRRIRNTLIASIKTAEEDGVNKEQLKLMIANIKTIDEVMSQTKIYRNWVQKFSNFVFPWHRKTISDIQMQQTLEEMGNNTLFLRSAELKAL